MFSIIALKSIVLVYVSLKLFLSYTDSNQPDDLSNELLMPTAGTVKEKTKSKRS